MDVGAQKNNKNAVKSVKSVGDRGKGKKTLALKDAVKKALKGKDVLILMAELAQKEVDSEKPDKGHLNFLLDKIAKRVHPELRAVEQTMKIVDYSKMTDADLSQQIKTHEKELRILTNKPKKK